MAVLMFPLKHNLTLKYTAIAVPGTLLSLCFPENLRLKNVCSLQWQFHPVRGNCVGPRKSHQGDELEGLQEDYSDF